MNRSMLTRSRAVAATLALAPLLGACGSDEPQAGGEAATPAPAAAAFPEAEGTIDDLVAEIGSSDEMVASPAGAVFTPGDTRFGFGLFDVGGAQITDADVAIYAAPGPTAKAQGPFPARVESLETKPAFLAESTAPDDAKAVFVSEVPFDTAGEWRIAAIVDGPEGFVATRIPSVVVDTYAELAAVGDPAPSVQTPTLADVGPANVAEIDTRVPPSSMHDDDLAEVLGEEAVVLLFATPALCVSRVCGPVVDIAEQVKSGYDDEVAFIHMEIYEDNVLDPENLRPQVEAYGLPTEPWLFVIDEEGLITTRIEGAFSVAELERALDPLVG